MKWIKINKVVSVSNGTTITYRLEGTPYTVESRKRPIPHANRAGTWDHTSYFVLKDGVEVAEKHSLGYAKEYAEALNKEATTGTGDIIRHGAQRRDIFPRGKGLRNDQEGEQP